MFNIIKEILVIKNCKIVDQLSRACVIHLHVYKLIQIRV